MDASSPTVSLPISVPAQLLETTIVHAQSPVKKSPLPFHTSTSDPNQEHLHASTKAPLNNQAPTPSNDTENPRQDLSDTSSHAPPTSTYSMVTRSKRGIVQPNLRYALLVSVDTDLVEPFNFG
jgi:hypothetical protein